MLSFSTVPPVQNAQSGEGFNAGSGIRGKALRYIDKKVLVTIIAIWPGMASGEHEISYSPGLGLSGDNIPELEIV